MSVFNNHAAVHNQAGVQIIYGNFNSYDHISFASERSGPSVRGELPGPNLNVQSIPDEAIDDQILDSLAFPQMSDRKRTIDPAHRHTCSWISDLSEYTEWTRAARGLLWIKGKPGSGKSTLMSHMYSNMCQRRSESDIRLEFFYSARGVPLQYTPLGMLRTLLNQIFSQDHSTRRLLRKLYREKCASFGSSERRWEWQLAELKTVFLDMVCASAQSHQVVIFVDALDEAGEQAARDVARYFHLANDLINDQRASARICISCRHYPIPSTNLAVEIHVERHNTGDIHTFLTDYLHINDLTTHLADQQEEWLALVDDLVNMARGVFQWTILVAPMVARWMSDGDTPEDIRERLSEVPGELRDVYRHILENVIDRHHRAKSLRLFQWITLAQNPLTVATIRRAMINLDSDKIISGDQHNSLALFAELNGMKGDMRPRVRSWSGGLIEIVASGEDAIDEYMVVQVIHQSVKDFLTDVGLSILFTLNGQPKKAEPAESFMQDISESIQISHGILYSCCLKYLSVKCTEFLHHSVPLGSIQGAIHRDEERTTFLQYASHYCLIHAQHARSYRSQDLAVESSLLGRALPLLRSCRVSRLYESGIGFYTSGMVLHMAAEMGLDDLVDFKILSRDELHAKDDFGWTALHFAIECSHLGVVERLINAGCDIEAATKQGETPLFLAASRGDEKMFTWLITHNADINATNGYSESILYTAAYNSSLRICQLCVKTGTDVNIRGRRLGTPLHAAAYRGNISIAQILLEAGAVVNARGGWYGSALRTAIAAGNLEMARFLISAGADINAQGGCGGAVLLKAIYGNDVEKVNRLVEDGALDKQIFMPEEDIRSITTKDIT